MIKVVDTKSCTTIASSICYYCGALMLPLVVSSKDRYLFFNNSSVVIYIVSRGSRHNFIFLTVMFLMQGETALLYLNVDSCKSLGL